MQIFLACLTFSIAWATFIPESSMWGYVPGLVLTSSFSYLVAAFGRKRATILITAGIAVFAFDLFLFVSRHPRRPVVVKVPSYLKDYATIDRGILYSMSQPNADRIPFYTSWIHAPMTQVAGLLRWYGTRGRGFDTSDKDSVVHTNFDTGESWNVYPGERDLPAFPSTSSETIHAGTLDTWTTLVYRPPVRSGS
ncbi:MAG TPA: hypothetical protein VMI31_09555 [Fimbriimonadaceae bacterium]|nr:hypothetical protein [Fimbriimonadaceae bacterium]